LSGIDNVHTSNGWRLSSLVNFRSYKVHDQSQLTSLTWKNSTSAWVHYQDINGQLQEFGMDDYRDLYWRNGSYGPLGLCLIGTGIGANRWVSPDGEVEELFCQAANLEIQGRRFANQIWNTQPYSVDWTLNNVSTTSSIVATTVKQGSDSFVLLAYVGSDESLTVQTRALNLSSTDYSAFSVPVGLFGGDGTPKTGLAAFEVLSQAWIMFVVETKIYELSTSNVTSGKWVPMEISF
jgi:hypothetical protein